MTVALPAIVGMDIHGRFTRWTKEAEELFGWAAEEVMGKDVAQTVIPPQHRAAHNEALRLLREEGKLEYAPALGNLLLTTAMHKDGRRLDVYLYVTQVDHEFIASFRAA